MENRFVPYQKWKTKRSKSRVILLIMFILISACSITLTILVLSDAWFFKEQTASREDGKNEITVIETVISAPVDLKIQEQKIIQASFYDTSKLMIAAPLMETEPDITVDVQADEEMQPVVDLIIADADIVDDSETDIEINIETTIETTTTGEPEIETDDSVEEVEPAEEDTEEDTIDVLSEINPEPEEEVESADEVIEQQPDIPVVIGMNESAALAPALRIIRNLAPAMQQRQLEIAMAEENSQDETENDNPDEEEISEEISDEINDQIASQTDNSTRLPQVAPQINIPVRPAQTSRTNAGNTQQSRQTAPVQQNPTPVRHTVQPVRQTPPTPAAAPVRQNPTQHHEVQQQSASATEVNTESNSTAGNTSGQENQTNGEAASSQQSRNERPHDLSGLRDAIERYNVPVEPTPIIITRERPIPPTPEIDEEVVQEQQRQLNNRLDNLREAIDNYSNR